MYVYIYIYIYMSLSLYISLSLSLYIYIYIISSPAPRQEYKREVTRTDEGREAWVKWGEEVAAAAREAGRQVD